jgi:hypothetical protein
MIYKNIPKAVVAIRPVRIVGNELRHYTKLTAPAGKDRNVWVRSVLNRISVFPVGEDHYQDLCAIDLLDKEGDIICEYTISRAAFRYAQQQLRFKKECNEKAN